MSPPWSTGWSGTGWRAACPATSDRRVVLVSLTGKGRAWFDEVAAAHEAEIDALFAGLDHHELDTIRDLLKRLEEKKHDEAG